MICQQPIFNGPLVFQASLTIDLRDFITKHDTAQIAVVNAVGPRQLAGSHLKVVNCRLGIGCAGRTSANGSQQRMTPQCPRVKPKLGAATNAVPDGVQIGVAEPNATNVILLRLVDV